MPKIILEKSDIEKLIKDKYPGCDIVSGMDHWDDIIIRVENFQPAPRVVHVPQLQVQSVDEKAPNALALRNPEETVPGGRMGRARGSMPTF